MSPSLGAVHTCSVNGGSSLLLLLLLAICRKAGGLIPTGSTICSDCSHAATAAASWMGRRQSRSAQSVVWTPPSPAPATISVSLACVGDDTQ